MILLPSMFYCLVVRFISYILIIIITSGSIPNEIIVWTWVGSLNMSGVWAWVWT